MRPRLELSREQVLSFRRRVGLLDERMPAGEESLRRAAWAGLQDSVPRAALLSLHARVEGVDSAGWEHPSLVQLWGPRFSDYVVAAEDLAVFSLGRLPENAAGRRRAVDIANRLEAFLQGRRMAFGQAGHAMGVPPNSLRYAAATGRVLMRWDGARQPVVWTVPAPEVEPEWARLELARRYLHIFGPATADSFAKWAGIGRPAAGAALRRISNALAAVRTPAGEAWILAEDETMFRARSGPVAEARLIPSGDAFWLAWGADRELLVPNTGRREQLWTSRVWPGALLVRGEFAGVWRRSGLKVTIEFWRQLSMKKREAVEDEVALLPLAGPATFEGKVRTGRLP